MVVFSDAFNASAIAVSRPNISWYGPPLGLTVHLFLLAR